MVSKTLLDGKTVQVTFRMPPLEGVSELHLCGDFNGWNTTAAPLARQADGSWTATLVLEPGKSYRYRFCDGEGRWHNDWQPTRMCPTTSAARTLWSSWMPRQRGSLSEKKPVAKKPVAREAVAKSR